MSLKYNILIELEKNRETYISGQFLANKFGVSRNAVWKAVNSLKESGYDINSSANRGYQLYGKYDRLFSEGIIDRLDNKTLPVYVCETIDSTNDEAKRILSQKKENSFLVVADQQTGGRGRMGREFYSPAGSGLYMTLVLSPQLQMKEAVGITAYAAVCVVRAIKRLTDKKCKIKWVNDIFYEEKKICGILSEAISDFESASVAAIIIGIGINLHEASLPEEIKNVAGFLNIENISRNELAAEITNELMSYKGKSTSYIEEYKEHSFVLGKEIHYTQNGKKYSAKAIDVDNDGALIVKNNDGEIVVLNSGEISVKIK